MSQVCPSVGAAAGSDASLYFGGYIEMDMIVPISLNHGAPTIESPGHFRSH